MGMPGTYNDGRAYFLARGRRADRRPVEDRFATVHPIIRGFPTVDEFLAAVKKELKIRFYARGSIKQYMSRLRCFLNWFGQRPHRVRVESVREFLETLVDGGAEPSTLVGYLAAIRTAFDKFCGRSVTLGLQTPRKSKRLPYVPNRSEIIEMIRATATARQRLLMELMYASGFRVSEIAKLRWKQIDFERSRIRVDSGKGRVDRMVLLPDRCRETLQHLFQVEQVRSGEEFVFYVGERTRHVSTRQIERIFESTRSKAKILKRIVPHSFRHAFATHLIEDGTDVRFVQKLLGHARLETTALYTRTAQPRDVVIRSPLDTLASA